MIAWTETRIRWNKDHRTNYSTRKEFLIELYKKYPSVHRIAQKIYINANSILKAMVADDIKRLPKGHRFPSSAMELIIELDTRKMTRREIAEKTGLSSQYIWVLLKRFKKSWKKLKN